MSKFLKIVIRRSGCLVETCRLSQYTNFLLLCNKLPQTLWLKMTHWLSHSFYASEGWSIAGLFVQGVTGWIKVWVKMHSHLKIWGRICFQTHSGFWQNLFPCDHILEDPGLLLAIGWRSPLGPRSHPQFIKAAGSSLPFGITQHDSLFHLVPKKRLWLQSAKQNFIYHNLKMGMNHLSHIPLVRSITGSTAFKKRKLHKGMNIRRWDLLRITSGSIYQEKLHCKMIWLSHFTGQPHMSASLSLFLDFSHS